jgi:hypothetical protein
VIPGIKTKATRSNNKRLASWTLDAGSINVPTDLRRSDDRFWSSAATLRHLVKTEQIDSSVSSAPTYARLGRCGGARARRGEGVKSESSLAWPPTEEFRGSHLGAQAEGGELKELHQDDLVAVEVGFLEHALAQPERNQVDAGSRTG